MSYSVSESSNNFQRIGFVTLFTIIAGGAILCILFESGYILPLTLSVGCFGAALMLAAIILGIRKQTLLVFLILLLYSLPFVHLLEYLWNPDIILDKNIWGLYGNPYQRNMDIVLNMAMLGCIGCLGLVAGSSFGKMIGKDMKRSMYCYYRVMTIPSYLFMGFMSLFLSYINTPQDTIFLSRYTMSQNLLQQVGINFNAAWLLSYIFAVIMLVDVFRESRRKQKGIKVIVLVCLLAVIVVWMQFMRGDRECIGLIGAVFAFIVIKLKDMNFKKLFIILAAAFFIFVSANFVGAIRDIVWPGSQVSVSERKIDLFHGTWSAVLMTPLSVAGDYYYGLMKLKWGKTYWNYILSLPPAPIAQLIGYERSVEGTHGPAWEMRYGLGGTHAMVVPFMNFSSAGVLVVMFLYGWWVAWIERRMFFYKTPNRELFYGSIIVIAPFWFWYGEMYLIRAVMAYIIVVSIYYVLPKTRIRGSMVCLSSSHL
nr:hypothetical protein [uncultured Desulfobacter sp.]